MKRDPFPAAGIVLALALLGAVLTSARASAQVPAADALQGPAEARAASPRIREMRFSSQPIADILLALGEVAGRSIVPDETVRGEASYYFAETDFEAALRQFLETYKLHARTEGGVTYVSRIRAEWDRHRGLLTMHAEDAELVLLVRAASRAMSRTVLFDPLPAERLSIHADAVPPAKLLEMLLRRFPDYRLEVDSDFFYVRREARPSPAAAVQRQEVIEREGDLYSVAAQKTRLQELLAELFQKAGREYSLFVTRDVVIENLRFSGRSFEELLRLILEQAGADYAQLADVTYIFEIQQRDVLKKLKTTVRMPLVHVAARELPNLLPAGIADSRLLKVDAAGNAVILNGSAEEIAPLEDFIRSIDVPHGDLEYTAFTLEYLDPKNLKSVLPPEFAQVDVMLVPGTRTVVVPLAPERRQAFERYLSLVDRGERAAPVRLRYVRADDLLKSLPPSLAKEDVISTSDPSLVFVKGGEQRVAAFLEELRELDVPAPQIRYQFLVIQHQKGEGASWGDASAARYQIYPSNAGDEGAIIGTIGQLLSLEFDAVSALGCQAAARLSLDLSNNVARVMADTTLIGTAGQEVRFQNTETYRYREPEVQEDGSVSYTGVTREITAGLIFGVRGWVSGDRMITMDVNATVSKRGTDTSGTMGTLPPTSENVVNTRVRTEGGKPVVIGGLMRQEKTLTESRVPILGDIPLLGLLFRGRKESIDNTELVIYIVPHVEYAPEERTDVAARLARLYHRLVQGSLGEAARVKIDGTASPSRTGAGRGEGSQ